jgi:hypothetical protein
MDLLAEIRKINDPEKLNEILDTAKSQLQFATRFAYTPGTLALVDFNTRGLQEAVVTKVNGKTVHVVLLGDQILLPRGSRQWRVSPQMLQALPATKKADVQAKYDALKTSNPYIFKN